MDDALYMQLLHKPWVRGADGPAAFDCWGLVRHVYRVYRGVELDKVTPDRYDTRALGATFFGNPAFRQWARVDTPKHLDLVTMSRISKIDMHHCGLWMFNDNGSVFHCAERIGVLRSSMQELKMNGWQNLKFWRFIE